MTSQGPDQIPDPANPYAVQAEHDRMVEQKLRTLPAPAVVWFTWRVASRVLASVSWPAEWRMDAEAALDVLRRCIDGRADAESCAEAELRLRASKPHDEAWSLLRDMILEQALGIGASARSLRWVNDPEAPASSRQVARVAAQAVRTLGAKSFTGTRSRNEAMAAERNAQASDVALLMRIPAAWWADSTSEFAVANWLASIGSAREYWSVVIDIATERGISPYEATAEVGPPPEEAK